MSATVTLSGLMRAGFAVTAPQQCALVGLPTTPFGPWRACAYGAALVAVSESPSRAYNDTYRDSLAIEHRLYTALGYCPATVDVLWPAYSSAPLPLRSLVMYGFDGGIFKTREEAADAVESLGY